MMKRNFIFDFIIKLILMNLIVSMSTLSLFAQEMKTNDSTKLSNTETYKFKFQNDTVLQTLNLIRIKDNYWKFELSIRNNVTKKKNSISGTVHCDYVSDILIETEKGYFSNPYAGLFKNNGIEYHLDIKKGRNGFTEVVVSVFNPVTMKALNDFISLPMKPDN